MIEFKNVSLSFSRREILNDISMVIPDGQITAILGPPTVLLVLIGLMSTEGRYVNGTRVDHLGQPAAATRIHVSDVHGGEGAETEH